MPQIKPRLWYGRLKNSINPIGPIEAENKRTAMQYYKKAFGNDSVEGVYETSWETIEMLRNGNYELL